MVVQDQFKDNLNYTRDYMRPFLKNVKSFPPLYCISLKIFCFQVCRPGWGKISIKNFFSHLPLSSFPQHPPTHVFPNSRFFLIGVTVPSLINAHPLKARCGNMYLKSQLTQGPMRGDWLGQKCQTSPHKQMVTFKLSFNIYLSIL